MTTSPFPSYLKWFCVLAICIMSAYMLFIGQGIIAPLVFSLFVAIILNPIVNFLQRKKVNRVVAIIIALAIGILVMAALGLFISFQVANFADDYGTFKQKLNSAGEDMVQWCAATFNLRVDEINTWIKNSESQILKSLMSSMGQTLFAVGNVMVVVIVIPIYMFLILYYKCLLLEFIHKLFDKKHHKNVGEVLQSINGIIRSYLIGLMMEAGIMAVLNSVALLIIGVKYAILIGIVSALVNMIPYIGGFAAIMLPMAMALVTKSVVSAFIVLGVLMLIQFVDNNYIVPYIVAAKVKVNALAAVVVVLIGNELWGVAGMFLAIPIAALLKTIFDHVEDLKPWGFLLGDNIPESHGFLFGKKSKAKAAE